MLFKSKLIDILRNDQNVPKREAEILVYDYFTNPSNSGLDKNASGVRDLIVSKTISGVTWAASHGTVPLIKSAVQTGVGIGKDAIDTISNFANKDNSQLVPIRLRNVQIDKTTGEPVYFDQITTIAKELDDKGLQVWTSGNTGRERYLNRFCEQNGVKAPYRYDPDNVKKIQEDEKLVNDNLEIINQQRMARGEKPLPLKHPSSHFKIDGSNRAGSSSSTGETDNSDTDIVQDFLNNHQELKKKLGWFGESSFNLGVGVLGTLLLGYGLYKGFKALKKWREGKKEEANKLLKQENLNKLNNISNSQKISNIKEAIVKSKNGNKNS